LRMFLILNTNSIICPFRHPIKQKSEDVRLLRGSIDWTSATAAGMFVTLSWVLARSAAKISWTLTC